MIRPLRSANGGARLGTAAEDDPGNHAGTTTKGNIITMENITCTTCAASVHPFAAFAGVSGNQCRDCFADDWDRGAVRVSADFIRILGHR